MKINTKVLARYEHARDYALNYMVNLGAETHLQFDEGFKQTVGSFESGLFPDVFDNQTKELAGMLSDKIWYLDYLDWCLWIEAENININVSDNSVVLALERAADVLEKCAVEHLYDLDAFEAGVLCGKIWALSWVRIIGVSIFTKIY